KPKLTVRLNLQSFIYTGDTITLSCELQETGWEFFWYRNSQFARKEPRDTNTLSVRVNAGETVYQCRASKKIYNIYNNYDYVYTRLSDSVTITAKAKVKPTLRSFLSSLINSEDTITLSCDLQDWREWEFFWYINSKKVSNVATDTNTFSVNVNHALETEYQCSARWRSDYRYYTQPSDPVKITAKAKPKPTIRVNPQSSIYTGDTITLSCELQGTGWEFLYYYQRFQLLNSEPANSFKVTVNNAGETVYRCRARSRNYNNDYYYTQLSEPVKITVEERLQAVLSVSPQNWLTEGDSVTLSCEVTDSSTDWTFSWYTVVPHRDGLTAIQNNWGYLMYVELFSDSSTGSEGSYTLSPSALHHTGVYVCRGERGEPVSHTLYSNPQPLWISGEEK
ncbi:sialoadhesin-like, partial [Silurus meridionalis]